MGRRAVKRKLGSFFSRFWGALRSEHTIASFIWPHTEETDVVTDPQVVQIFWNGVMTELFITAFLGENTAGSFIQTIILALIGGGMLAGVVMLNRIVFRWGNRGRRFSRSKRELKGGMKKQGADGRLHAKGDDDAAAGADRKSQSKLRRKLSPTAWWRHVKNTTRWALAWLFNFAVFFVMTWFCLTYAMVYFETREDTEAWLKSFGIGFNTGCFVIEPFEVFILAAMPFLFDNSCVANCRQGAKDLGLV